MIKKTFVKAILQPYKVVSYINNSRFAWLIPDKLCLKCLYRTLIGDRLNLKEPNTFNEKLQWLKLYDRQDKYVELVDKYKVKEYISKKIGEQYVIKLLDVWEKVDDIDVSHLPEQFVLKTTHDSKGVVICEDKEKFDIESAKILLKRHMETNFFYKGREWPYKKVKPRVIAEEYLKDHHDGELRDYKFFCFHGVPKVLYITQGRNGNDETFADFFDMEFKHLEIQIDHKMAPYTPHKPQNFELMKELASALSKDIPHVRVDFYEANGKVYFGELTFYHCSGFVKFKQEEVAQLFGSWIDLEMVENNDKIPV